METFVAFLYTFNKMSRNSQSKLRAICITLEQDIQIEGLYQITGDFKKK